MQSLGMPMTISGQAYVQTKDGCEPIGEINEADIESFSDYESAMRRITRKYFAEIKPNPHNYPIIDKWNWRVIHKNGHAYFNEIYPIIEKAIADEIREQYKKFVDISEIASRPGFLDPMNNFITIIKGE